MTDDKRCPACGSETLDRHDGDVWCTADDCLYLLEDVDDRYPVPAPDPDAVLDDDQAGE